MVAVAAQIVRFLPQIFAIRPHFGEELAQTPDLRLQFQDFGRRFFGRVRCRCRDSVTAPGNLGPAAPDGRWSRPGADRSSLWPTIHQTCAPLRTRVENRQLLEFR
jgi:hypothetical protein